MRRSQELATGSPLANSDFTNLTTDSVGYGDFKIVDLQLRAEYNHVQNFKKCGH